MAWLEDVAGKFMSDFFGTKSPPIFYTREMCYIKICGNVEPI